MTPFAKLTSGTLLSAVAALGFTGCHDAQTSNDVEIPDIIEAGQNFTGSNNLNYPTIDGLNDDCDGDGCEPFIIDVCSMTAAAHSLAIILPGISQTIYYEDDCVDSSGFRNAVLSEASILAVVAGQPMPRKIAYVTPQVFPQTCGQERPHLAIVRMVNGVFWLVGCVEIVPSNIDTPNLSSDAVNHLPRTFDELSAQSIAALNDYEGVCGRQPRDLSRLDSIVDRLDECPERTLDEGPREDAMDDGPVDDGNDLND